MTTIYKICEHKQWSDAERDGAFRGSAVDYADGYIHFSTAAQVAATAGKHFAGMTGLVIVAVDAQALDAKTVEIASRLAEQAPAATRWTKHTLNHWLRQAAPIFDASLALEFIGFAGPEGREGIDAFLQKRAAVFPTATNS